MQLFDDGAVVFCSSTAEQETHQEMRYPNVTTLYFTTPLASCV